MTKQEIYDAVIRLVDDHSHDISNAEYADLMHELSEDFNSRAEAADADIENEA